MLKKERKKHRRGTEGEKPFLARMKIEETKGPLYPHKTGQRARSPMETLGRKGKVARKRDEKQFPARPRCTTIRCT